MQIKKGLITFNVKPCMVVRQDDRWYGGSKKFWQLLSDGYWEPETFTIFDRFLSKDKSYLDIGAWVGPTVLYGANLCKTCYAVEPDPVAYSILVDNISENANLINIKLFNNVVAGYSGKINFGTNTNKGDSMSSILGNKESWITDCISLEDLLSSIDSSSINFIKMDIEGGEFYVLPSAKNILSQLKPTLYLSLHIPFFNDRQNFLNTIYDSVSNYKNIYFGEKLISYNDFIKLDGNIAILVTDE